MYNRRLLILATGPVLMFGCSKPQVRTVEPYAGGPMPRPDRVLVAYFSVTPEQVQLDQGVAARIQRQVNDPPPNANEMHVAEQTQVALASQLVDRLRAYGLPAELGGRPDGPGTALLVQGQIVAIDQGNRTRRVLIGLGAGKSSVSADTQLYYTSETIAPPRFLTAFEGEANSGRMPGAVGTMGAGAAAQTLATSAAITAGTHAASESRRSSGSVEANNLAKAIAQQIGQFAASQGWISDAALH